MKGKQVIAQRQPSTGVSQTIQNTEAKKQIHPVKTIAFEKSASSDWDEQNMISMNDSTQYVCLHATCKEYGNGQLTRASIEQNHRGHQCKRLPVFLTDISTQLDEKTASNASSSSAANRISSEIIEHLTIYSTRINELVNETIQLIKNVMSWEIDRKQNLDKKIASLRELVAIAKYPNKNNRTLAQLAIKQLAINLTRNSNTSEADPIDIELIHPTADISAWMEIQKSISSEISYTTNSLQKQQKRIIELETQLESNDLDNSSSNSLNAQQQLHDPLANNSINESSSSNSATDFIAKLNSRIKAHETTIRDLVFIGKDKFATCSYDKSIRIWNVNSQELEQIVNGHTDEVYQLVYSQKHKLIASSSYDSTIRIWKEFSEWKTLKTLEGHVGKTWAIVFLDKSDMLASGGSDKTVRIWNILRGECTFILTGHSETIWSLCESAKGLRLSSGDDSRIKVWDFMNGKSVKTIEAAHTDRIYVLKELDWPMSNRNTSSGETTSEPWLISGSMDRRVKVWNCHNYSLVYVFEEQATITSLSVFLEHSILAFGLWGEVEEDEETQDGSVKSSGGVSFWSLENVQLPVRITDFTGNQSGVSSLAFHEDTSQMVSSHSDGYVAYSFLGWKGFSVLE